ncbi:MAG: hypothetical protein H0V70_18875, partial [Ktedonobacteraceae bacterium]|nr:hypothetical protein [Ktedonobacteraceae bacterium]
MKKTFIPPEVQKSPTLATWYRALALPERIPPPEHTASPSNKEFARKRLQRWKEQLAFRQEGQFAARLTLDGLTEEDLLTLLTEPIEALQERISPPLPWLEELLHTFTDTQDQEDVILLLPQDGFDPHHLAFLTVLKPLLRNGIRRIQATLQTLQTSYSSLPF